MGYGKKIEERGSLQLHHFEGNDREPETFTVSMIERPDLSASLEVARDWFTLSSRGGDVRLNGSQAQTVKAWANDYI